MNHTYSRWNPRLSATGGLRAHLHYDNPQGRLTDIKRLVNNEAVETLAQYLYYENGQLTAVINHNGDPLGCKTAYDYHHLTTLVTKVSYLDSSTWQARYDDKGNLLAEIDALGQITEYLNSDDGLPHTIIDATDKSKHLWWNTLAQVER